MLKFPLKIASFLWPKRRWCQYSVATMLLGVTAMCVALGVWADRAYRQRVAVETLRRRNAIVKYDFQELGFKEAPWRSRLRSALGDDYVADVVFVDLSPRTQRLNWAPKIWFEPPAPECAPTWQGPTLYRNPDGAGDTAGRFSIISGTWPPAAKDMGPNYKVTPLVNRETMRYVAELRRLERLDLSGSEVADQDLVHVGRLSRLCKLNLEWTRISDAGVRHLGGLRNLEELNLGSTRVTGSGFAALGGLTNLDHLRLGRTPFNDTGLMHVGKLQGLIRLNLDRTHLKGTELGRIRTLPHLRVLSLFGTGIDDGALSLLQPAENLEDLDIRSCPCVTATGDAELRRALPKCHVASDYVDDDWGLD